MIDWNGKLEVYDSGNGRHELHPVRPNPNTNRFWPFVAWCPSLEQDFYINKDNDQVNNGISTGNWTIRNVKEEKAVTEFRVGDRVRAVVADTAGGWEVGYETVLLDKGVKDKDGDIRYFLRHEWELVSSGEAGVVSEVNDELATLRAFKAMALERYPNLSEPESDDDAAYRLTKAYEAQDRGTPYDLARNAIVWARANPPKA